MLSLSVEMIHLRGGLFPPPDESGFSLGVCVCCFFVSVVCFLPLVLWFHFMCVLGGTFGARLGIERGVIIVT